MTTWVMVQVGRAGNGITVCAQRPACLSGRPRITHPASEVPNRWHDRFYLETRVMIQACIGSLAWLTQPRLFRTDGMMAIIPRVVAPLV